MVKEEKGGETKETRKGRREKNPLVATTDQASSSLRPCSQVTSLWLRRNFSVQGRDSQLEFIVLITEFFDRGWKVHSVDFVQTKKWIKNSPLTNLEFTILLFFQ